MLRLKETSRLGLRMIARRGTAATGNRSDLPASGHDVGRSGPPRVRQGPPRPKWVNEDVLANLDLDPRTLDVPQGPQVLVVLAGAWYRVSPGDDRSSLPYLEG